MTDIRISTATVITIAQARAPPTNYRSTLYVRTQSNVHAEWSTVQSTTTNNYFSIGATKTCYVLRKRMYRTYVDGTFIR